MVWICMVKVRFAYLALAHVSHFFRTGAVGLQAMDAFFRFWNFEMITAASSASVFGPRVALFPRTRAVGPKAMDAFCRSWHFSTFIVTSSASVFGHRVDVWAPFCSILSARSAVDLAKAPLLDMLFQNIISFGPPPHIFPKRPSLWVP